MVFLADYVNSSNPDNSDLAKQAQNPIANLISLPLQINTNFGIGPDNETQNILNIQPVWPFGITDNLNLITRTILPVVSQPDILTGGEGRINGLGDTTFTGFFSPKGSKRLTWGVGPVFLLPTATDDALGSDKWGAGASVVLLAMPGKWVVGSLLSNVWSFAGSSDQDVNLFTWQYFINYNMPNGWYLTSAPIITANWEADSDNTWTVPFGGGIGKIFNIGSQPINAQVSGYYNAVTSDFGADWQLRLQLQFLFPK
ncbi:MAG: neuromedin U [Deltaproteobacteria bacterium]|nr:neuromedin U [Deltaproteobacteria bacterium]